MTVTVLEAAQAVLARKSAVTGRTGGSFSSEVSEDDMRRLLVGMDVDLDELETHSASAAALIIDLICASVAPPSDLLEGLWVDGFMVGKLHAEMQAKETARKARRSPRQTFSAA